MVTLYSIAKKLSAHADQLNGIAQLYGIPVIWVRRARCVSEGDVERLTEAHAAWVNRPRVWQRDDATADRDDLMARASV
jgi:hypothetical protein